MSIAKDIWIKCDDCGDMQFASHTAKQARLDAGENGWVRRNNKDFCPRCAPNNASNGGVCTCGLKIDPVGWNRHAKDCPAHHPRRSRRPLVQIGANDGYKKVCN